MLVCCLGSHCSLLVRLKLEIIKHTRKHTRTLGGWYYEFQWNTEVTDLETSIGTSFNVIYLPVC